MYLVDPVHVILKLLQILDVAVTDLTDDESGTALLLSRLCYTILLRCEAGIGLPLANTLCITICHLIS